MSDKPIFKTLWAERGAKQEVDTSKIALGWTAERPPFQWENWSQWRQDAFIAHINVRGIPEWDEETEYGVGVKSYVAGSNGEIYVSIAPSGGTYPARDPVVDVIKWKKAWLDADGAIGIPKVVGLQEALDNKVDKRDGYGLSSNDYTSIEKSKLGGIESNAQRNIPVNLSNSRTSSSVTITSSSGTDTTIGGATQTVSGVMVATDKAKLDGLPTGAGGLIPLSGGGTGSSNAAGARLALQLGNHSTHNYGTTANTVMMGNDPRVVRINQDLSEGLATKADKTTNISTGVGLTGGGNLSTNRTISANFGTTANTVAMGNDSRINNGQSAYNRLNIGATAATARAALELGAQATRWPTWGEVTNKPVVQTTGNSTTDIMSQKAVTDALGSAGSSGIPDKNNILFSNAVKTSVEFEHLSVSSRSGYAISETSDPYSTYIYSGGMSCKSPSSGGVRAYYTAKGISIGSSAINLVEFNTISGKHSASFKGTIHADGGIKSKESTGSESFVWAASGFRVSPTGTTGIVANIAANGVASFVDVNITSDERYKSNKTKIANPIDKVNALSGYNYTLHSEIGGDVVGESVGILAQDVEKVMPECVTDTDGKLSVSYSGITALLVETVKDMNARIIELEKTIEMMR